MDTTHEENQWHWKCHSIHQGRQNNKTFKRLEDHQREGLFIPSPRESGQEGLHHDGGTILCDSRVTVTGQGGPRGLPDDKMEHRKTTSGTHQYGHGGIDVV